MHFEQEPTDETMDESSSDPGTEARGSEDQLLASARPPVNRGTFALFMVMLALGGGTYLMYMKVSPRSANGGMVDAGGALVIQEFLTGKTGGVQMMRQTLTDSERVVAEFEASNSRPQVPLGDLKTNPFRHGAERRALADGSEAVNRRRREEERTAVLKAVQGLQLQSVIHGDSRRACMINNAMFQEGQQLEGFTVEQIGPQSVVVRNGVYRFELRMQK